MPLDDALVERRPPGRVPPLPISSTSSSSRRIRQIGSRRSSTSTASLDLQVVEVSDDDVRHGCVLSVSAPWAPPGPPRTSIQPLRIWVRRREPSRLAGGAAQDANRRRGRSWIGAAGRSRSRSATGPRLSRLPASQPRRRRRWRKGCRGAWPSRTRRPSASTATGLWSGSSALLERARTHSRRSRRPTPPGSTITPLVNSRSPPMKAAPACDCQECRAQRACAAAVAGHPGSQGRALQPQGRLVQQPKEEPDPGAPEVAATVRVAEPGQGRAPASAARWVAAPSRPAASGPGRGAAPWSAASRTVDLVHSPMPAGRRGPGEAGGQPSGRRRVVNVT